MRAVRHVSSPTPGDHGLTLPRAAVLRALREADGCRANDIAADLGISPSALSRHIAELEELGLLTRTTDPDDARARILTVSPLGEQRLAEAQRERAQRLIARFTDWSDETAQQVLDALTTLAAALETDPHRPSPASTRQQ